MVSDRKDKHEVDTESICFLIIRYYNNSISKVVSNPVPSLSFMLDIFTLSQRHLLSPPCSEPREVILDGEH